MKTGSKILALALLFVGLVLVNYLATKVPFRADATAENIYTLSPGTKAILQKIEEPITVDFYFSRDASGLPIIYKNYADRVEEMLRQYARAADGKLILHVVNPEPDTPEEEQATRGGLQAQIVPGTGEQVYFGVVVTQADQQKAISAFNPQREQFLEYDLSELVHSVQQFDKHRLGLISSLPLQAPPMNPMMMQQPRQAPQDQYVIGEWSKNFEIVPIEATATTLPANLDALAVIHPTDLDAGLTFAIDQFLLGGKPVFIAVDPASQYFKRQGGQQAMFGGPQPNVASNLPKLFAAWGVTYDPQNVVGDLTHATQVQTGAGQLARFPVWLSLPADTLNRTAMPTAQLNSMLIIEPGALALADGHDDMTFTSLIDSSAQSGTVPAYSLQFAQPDEVSRQIVASGPKTLAALLTGTFHTAFPDGPPETAKPEADAPAKSAIESRKTGQSTLLVIADTDFLLDDYSVRRMNFLGVQTAEALNDNLAFAANAIDYLAGSQDLISIRGKGSSQRPFTVVQQMEVTAQQKYQDQLAALESRLAEVQQKLSQLQTQTTDTNRLIASPEVQQTIEEFQAQEAAMRVERREIRRALREDIDALKTRLLLINLLASPLLIAAFGFWFYRNRRR